MTDFYTPVGGHRVHVIVGNAVGIQERGAQIEHLGEQMLGAAGVLREISGGATEEKGRSIERIRDEVDGAHEELELAGLRYKPTGTAMKEYGETLATVQSSLRGLVPDIISQIADVEAKQQAANEADRAYRNTADYDPDDSSEVAERNQAWREANDAAGELSAATTHMNELCGEFDTQWNTWDTAYNAALSKVTKVTEGALTDHWTDRLATIVEIVIQVISVAGIIVAIAALVIGGPLIALIGAVLALVALIGTAFLFFKGRVGRGELGWAIVGALPFGRLASVFQKGARLQSLKFLGGPVFDIGESWGQLRSLRGIRSSIRNLDDGWGLGQRARSGLASRVSHTFANIRWQDIRTVPSNVIHNAVRGGGAWSKNMADAFSDFTRHHQSVVTRAGGAGTIIQHGEESISTAQAAFNLVDFGVTNVGTVRDTVDVVDNLLDGGPDVDSWREQLMVSQ